MSHVNINPIKQDISFRVDVEGLQVQCVITVTDEKKYPFDKMARLAKCIKTDIEDQFTPEEAADEQVVLTFKDEESMIDFFKEVYKMGVRQGEALGKLQERSKK